MVNLLIRRLFLAVLTLVLVSIIVFIAIEALPGDMATAALGREASNAESLAATREEFGLNRPAIVRYFEWFGGVLQGDLGDSIVRRKPITELIGFRLRNTLVLAAAASAVGIPLSIFLGVFTGLYRDKMPDVIVSTIAIFAMTLPEFVTGTVLVYFLAIRRNWFPPLATMPTGAPISEVLPNIALPIITLTLVMVAHILRLVRTSMIDVMISDYVNMARLKGVPAWRIVWKHALPNAMLPTINIVALTIAWLLGGVVIIEAVFNYPGIGTLMLNGISDRDLFLVQGIAMILAAIYVFVNLAADVATILLNPRLRTSLGS